MDASVQDSRASRNRAQDKWPYYSPPKDSLVVMHSMDARSGREKAVLKGAIVSA